MEKVTCEECGKIIEGYNLNQCAWLLAQHKLKHFVDRERKLLKEENKK